MLLTNSEIMDINQNAEFDSAIGYARKIESAVLEKLKAQEPVYFWLCDGCGQYHQECEDGQGPVSSCNCMTAASMFRKEFYQLPPSDVVQKYEELLYAVARKFPDETRHQTALRYIKTSEAPSYTNAAMKESK